MTAFGQKRLVSYLAVPYKTYCVYGSPFAQFCPYLTRSIFPVTGLSGDKFKFNERGDGPARYNIIHYKQVRPGRYEWVKVGFFNDDQIEMNMSGEETTVCRWQNTYRVTNPSPPRPVLG